MSPSQLGDKGKEGHWYFFIKKSICYEQFFLQRHHTCRSGCKWREWTMSQTPVNGVYLIYIVHVRDNNHLCLYISSFKAKILSQIHYNPNYISSTRCVNRWFWPCAFLTRAPCFVNQWMSRRTTYDFYNIKIKTLKVLIVLADGKTDPVDSEVGHLWAFFLVDLWPSNHWNKWASIFWV